jgi:hypothetical protein
MPLRKYQAATNRDARVLHTGDGFVFVRGGEAGPPIWPPPPPPPPPPCPAAGIVISTQTEDFMYDAGCGPVQIGYTYTDTITDGECGTTTETRNECNVGDFTTCNGFIYSSDAQCNVTSRPEDPPCPPDGTYISGPHSTEDYMYDAGCGPIQIGYSYTYTVADGQCGTRESVVNECNVGDFTTCNGLIYTSDAQCNISTRPENEDPPPPPPECEDPYLHAGEAGWTYDGCYWSYTEPNP